MTGRRAAADGAQPGRPARGARGADRYERSARIWLRAYPRRWRDLHGDEALAVLLDLAPEPDDGAAPRGIGAREAWGLVRAGWALRWREHPPLGRWLLYRSLDLRLPARYWWWVADDIHGALYPWRVTLGSLGSALAILYGWPVLSHVLFSNDVNRPELWFAVLLMAVSLLSGFLFRRSHVDRAWRKHVLDGNIPVDTPDRRRAAGG
ncbi:MULTISPECIES: hypothetical protein [Cellulosimicrobium]|uniref:hypothetical protein n=1 Tax=unclassified Cellulosimicrobium TaxID=2624466 RepID=UPI000A179BC3|nr:MULTISPECIES: hypothetical protein [unclassified Cellulosimicrobium]ARK03529.1 hypothetical protein B8281_01070 [Cellulosimicrobium sp. TH-20]